VLNRRMFLTVVVSAATGILAACRGGRAPASAVESPGPTQTDITVEADPTMTSSPAPTATPTPTYVRVWLDQSVAPHFSSAAADVIAVLDGIQSEPSLQTEQVNDPAAADVRITVAESGALANAIVWARAPLALVTSPRVPISGVTVEQARGLIDGAIAGWSDVGSPKPIDVFPVTIAGSGSAAAPKATVATFQEFVTLFATHPGAIGLAFPSDVDFRVGVVPVGGVDLLRSSDPPSDYPFHRDLILDLSPSLPDSIAASLRGAAVTPQSVGTGGPRVAVTLVGDVILGRTVHTIMTRQNDFAAPFRLVADELKWADLTIADLECTLSDNITPPTDPYTFSFMTYTKGVEGLQLAGIDGVSQANNHSMNFGVQGMHDTLAALDKVDIPYFGIGPDLATARRPLVLEAKGLRIAWLGYDGITGDTYGATPTSPGTSPLVADYVAADVAAAAGTADIVIPFIHWGVEYTLVPTAQQRAIARQAIDAGASMVVGSHPHWVQGIEIYQGRPILYSLANFVFDQDWSLETKQGLILHLFFSGPRLAGLRLVPVLIENFYRPRIVSGADLVTILDRVWSSTDTMEANPV